MNDPFTAVLGNQRSSSADRYEPRHPGDFVGFTAQSPAVEQLVQLARKMTFAHDLSSWNSRHQHWSYSSYDGPPEVLIELVFKQAGLDGRDGGVNAAACEALVAGDANLRLVEWQWEHNRNGRAVAIGWTSACAAVNSLVAHTVIATLEERDPKNAFLERQEQERAAKQEKSRRRAAQRKARLERKAVAELAAQFAAANTALS